MELTAITTSKVGRRAKAGGDLNCVEATLKVFQRLQTIRVSGPLVRMHCFMRILALACTLASGGCGGAPPRQTGSSQPPSGSQRVATEGFLCDELSDVAAALEALRGFQGDAIILKYGVDFDEHAAVAEEVRELADGIVVEPFAVFEAQLIGPGGTSTQAVHAFTSGTLNRIAARVSHGSLTPLIAGASGLALSTGVAQHLGVGLGDRVRITASDPGDSLSGWELPDGVAVSADVPVVATLTFPAPRVTGLDGHAVLVALAQGHAIAAGAGRVTGMTVFFPTAGDATEHEPALRARVSSPYQVITFAELNRGLLRSIDAVRANCDAPTAHR